MSMVPASDFKTLPTAIVFVLLLVTPLGVAGQNAGLAIAIIGFLFWTVKGEHRKAEKFFAAGTISQFITLWALFTIPIAIATIRRGAIQDSARFILGQVMAAAMVVGALRLRAAFMRRDVLLNTATLLIGFMGVIAASQMLIGWKLEGIKFADQIKRAQGFYSHPLTFAYVALVFMPWGFARVMARPKQWQSWVIALGLALILTTTQSVTVLCVSALVVFFLMTRLLSKKHLVISTLIAVTAVATLISTPNPIQTKFQMVLTGQRGDHETPYPDDRMAFWHAHWEMIKDSPWLGHGTGLEAADRRPYYEALGLGHLKRMYEAHNMYLQAAVEGGVIASLALMAFLAWWFRIAKTNRATEEWFRLAMMCTPVAFALGGLTQNAIQDSEVRYSLMLLCGFSLWFKRNDNLST